MKISSRSRLAAHVAPPKQPPPNVVPLVRNELLARACAAVRARQPDEAESILNEADDGLRREAASLNLLGLVAESRGQWHIARRMWSLAARTDPQYQPPRRNLRRYYELFQWGRCRECASFGDEPEFAELPRKVPS
jgi:hypothetical protein